MMLVGDESKEEQSHPFNILSDMTAIKVVQEKHFQLSLLEFLAQGPDREMVACRRRETKRQDAKNAFVFYFLEMSSNMAFDILFADAVTLYARQMKCFSKKYITSLCEERFEHYIPEAGR